MFDTISKGFRTARERLTGKGELTEEVVNAALRDVRVSLLEADVEFGVVKQFLNAVKEKALGQKVQLTAKTQERKMRVRAEDHFVRICHDELVDLMGPVDTSIQRASKGISGVMMVGLQGSGKTTTTAKLARKLQKADFKVMMVAADIYRPAAIHQLRVLGEQLAIPVFYQEGKNPVEICTAATEQAAQEGIDFILYDTAGRLAVDEPLMVELEHIKSQVHPANIFLVIDAMTGQDAVTTAKAFDQRLDISGVVLTKLDGDARGGAALSIKATTGKPIKFLGMGESLEKLEEFRPDGLAGRILGMGDLVGLMEDFQEVVDEETAANDAAKMLGGNFTMDDFLKQIKTIQNMGSLRDLMDKMPLASMFGIDLPKEALEQAADEKELEKVESMISSMTRKERENPELFLAGSEDNTNKKGHEQLSRRKRRPPMEIKDPNQLRPRDFVSGRIARVARGSGHSEDEIRGLISRFLFMRNMFGSFGDLLGGFPGMPGGGGLMSKIPGMNTLKQINSLRKLAKHPDALQSLMGGGMPGLGGGLGGFPELGAAASSSGGKKSQLAQSLKRKQARKARKKNRRK